MKFRTEIEVKPLPRQIEYSDNIVSIGSCFAENMSRRLAEYKFKVTSSPTGILFNPVSIANAIEQMLSNKCVEGKDLIAYDGQYVSYDFHSAFAGKTTTEATTTMNSALRMGGEALRHADHVIITLGTAWVYRLVESGCVVANCHKQPHSLFRRERLTVDEVFDKLQQAVSLLDHNTQIILTLSPVRHIGEGLEDNSLSKAILRVAIDMLCARFSNVVYFPAFELLTDDLRDYRFYADDLVHPSTSAIEYIGEKFFGAALSPRTKQLTPKVEQIVRAAKHRSMNPHSNEYKSMCRRNLDSISTLKELDFAEEKLHFERMLQINL